MGVSTSLSLIWMRHVMKIVVLFPWIIAYGKGISTKPGREEVKRLVTDMHKCTRETTSIKNKKGKVIQTRRKRPEELKESIKHQVTGSPCPSLTPLSIYKSFPFYWAPHASHSKDIHGTRPQRVRIGLHPVSIFCIYKKYIMSEAFRGSRNQSDQVFGSSMT